MDHASGLARLPADPPWTGAPRPSGSTPDYTLLDPDAPGSTPAPLFTFRLPDHLDGTRGSNRRASRFGPRAADDLAMLWNYLVQFKSQPQKRRRHCFELERFLLYLVYHRGKPLSSADGIDCREYLRFLARPYGVLSGIQTKRNSPRWVPFSSEPASPASRVRAGNVLRAAFTAFIDSGMLRANPWRTTLEAGYTGSEQIESRGALPVDGTTWQTVLACVAEPVEDDTGPARRLGLAGLLLVGEARLRREEAALATLDELRDAPAGGWYLMLRRRGGHNVSVEIGARAAAALRAHWADQALATPSAAAASRQPLLHLPVHANPLPGRQRTRLAVMGADELYEAMATALRLAYLQIEARLGLRAPTVHGLLQCLDLRPASA